MKIHAFRLTQGIDLKQAIETYAAKNEIKAGFVITCVAGLSKARLRMAAATPDKQDIRDYEGDYEVVSLVGTVSKNGCHLHISLSDKEGEMIGGHLKEGSIVKWTAELIIGEDADKVYDRELDPVTGFKELTIEARDLT